MNSLILNLEDIRSNVSELDYSSRGNSPSGADIWSNLFSKSLDENAKSGQIKVIKYLTNKYQKVVAEARRNRINLCQQFLKETEKIEMDLTKEEDELVKVFALPAKAYLFYKQSLYIDAIEATKEAMLIDERLEDRGFSILHYHRIQQLQNLCRIYFKMNDLDLAIKASNELLRYLTAGNAPSLFRGKWNQNLLDLASPDLRSAMIFQVMREMHSTCIKISNNNSDKQKRYHTDIFGGLSNFKVVTNDDKAILNWLTAKNQFYYEDYNNFIKTSLYFLRYESSQFDFFKYFLVKDILRVLAERQEVHELIPIVETLTTYAEEKLKKKEFSISSIIN